MSESRVIVWFSCGEASACALKYAVRKYGVRALPVYCNTSKSEEPDNMRFMRDVEKWTGTKVQFISSEKYQTVDEVFEARKYIAGIKGAPCTVEMKKIPRFKFQQADDIHVFGFTSDETRRIEQFKKNNPDMRLEWILLDNGVSREECTRMMESAGIERPLRYRQGFKNNNCRCCGKATSFDYWRLERKINPEDFKRRAEQSRRFGARLTRYKGQRIYLDEMLPEEALPPMKAITESVSCGPECGGER